MLSYLLASEVHDFETGHSDGSDVHRFKKQPEEFRVKGEVLQCDEWAFCARYNDPIRWIDPEPIAADFQSAQHRYPQ
jgi:hypothetical protein